MATDGADWLRTQLTGFGCASCGEPFQDNRIRLLAERDGLFFVDLACSHCGTQAVAIVTVQTDDDQIRVDPAEAVPLDAAPEAPPISSDDVLAVHAMLADFRGDANDLLARLEGRAGRRQAP